MFNLMRGWDVEAHLLDLDVATELNLLHGVVGGHGPNQR